MQCQFTISAGVYLALKTLSVQEFGSKLNRQERKMKSTGVSRYLLVVFAVFVTSFAVIDAYGTGAPVPQACAGAQPIHTTNGSIVEPLPSADNPYSFTFEVDEYIPGEDLEVTISEADGGMVNGFFLQARRTDTGVPVGTFQSPLPTGAQLRECTNAADSVTHTNPNGKTGLTFTWRPPAAGTGEVEFVGAVALNHDNFYGGMKSVVLSEGNGTTKLSSCFGLVLVALLVTIQQSVW